MTASLLVDGIRVPPAAVDAGWFQFNLRLPAREIRLLSGFARPVDLEASSDDRRLGVELRRIRWTAADRDTEVPVDSPAFIDGFHVIERRGPAGQPVRWTTGDAGLPPSVFPPWDGEVRLHLALGQWQGSARDNGDADEAVLLGAFENLGSNCEFALAQRHYGAEPPLSLLRWAAITYPNLLLGLETGFAGLDDAAGIDVRWAGSEYRLCTPFLRMHTTCNVMQDAAGIQAIRDQGRTTLRLLRRKLLRDIAAPQRIFVFASDDTGFHQPEMRRLHAALRRIGPANLLCVRLASFGEQPNHVERLSDGLYAGRVAGFGRPHGPYAQWLSLCAKAMSLHQQGEPQTRP